MARKTSKEYSKEYQDLLNKTKVLESRIKKRALNMCKKFPDVKIGLNSNTNHIIKLHTDEPNLSLTTNIYIRTISNIEKYNENQSGYVQTSMYEDELSQEDLMKAKSKDFIEYEDVNDDYEFPERKEVAEVLEIRLYCMHDDCRKYIKGNEGYNGMFTAETGQRCDLRNQGFKCKEHSDENKSDDKKENDKN